MTKRKKLIKETLKLADTLLDEHGNWVAVFNKATFEDGVFTVKAPTKTPSKEKSRKAA